MSVYTEGPWEVRENIGDYVDTRFSKFSILSDQYQIAAVITDVVSLDNDANARLIAGAPELLEALKLCAAVCAGETLSKRGLTEALQSARAAIAKATGEAA